MTSRTQSSYHCMVGFLIDLQCISARCYSNSSRCDKSLGHSERITTTFNTLAWLSAYGLYLVLRTNIKRKVLWW